MKRYDRGQSLIEIVLALSVAVVVITGITFAITSSLKNATFTKNQTLASSYAQQGMEVVRAIRDRSWTSFSSYNGWYCLAANSTELVGRTGLDCEPEGMVGIFIREVRMQVNNTDCEAGVPGTPNTKATVSVKWSDSKCPSTPPFTYCHEVKLISCFTNTNVVPTP